MDELHMMCMGHMGACKYMQQPTAKVVGKHVLGAIDIRRDEILFLFAPLLVKISKAEVMLSLVRVLPHPASGLKVTPSCARKT